MCSCALTACKKKPADTGAAAPAAEAAPKAPAGPEQEINAAFDRKDYEAVLAILLRTQQSVSNPDQQRNYAVLAHNAKMRLLDEAANDPKAAKVLATLRAMTQGR